MKEIGKLIELLNEWYQERYETNTRFDKFENYGGNDYGYFLSNDNEHFMYETDVWTKKFGFIKWLVENDKIDLNNIQDCFYVRSYDKNGIAEKYEYYEELLMLLSISDTPIEDLISYLK